MSTAGPKPAVYSYIRFSTTEQRKGTGQARQEKLAAEWCKSRGRPQATNYADLGVSAFKGKNSTHGDLARFLKCVEQNKIARGSTLIVESLDRLSRQNVSQALQLFLAIINQGVNIVTLCDDKEYSADKCEMTDLMMSLLIFARANDESRMKSQRKAASWASKRDGARAGKPIGGKLPSWLEVKEGKYVVIKSEANKVKAVFADYIRGAGVWKLYQQHGLPRSTIGYWLNSPNVIGDLIVTEVGTKVTIKRHYPPIIDRETWAKAQQLRASRYINRRSGCPSDRVNLFAGILVGANGERYDVAYPKPDRRLLLTPGNTIDADKFERAMIDHVLRQKFIRTHIVIEEKNDPRGEEVKKKIETLQRGMIGEDADTAAAMLPVLRELTRQQRAFDSNRQKTEVEQVDYSLVQSLLQDGGNKDERLQAREIIRETVSKIVVEAHDGDSHAKLNALAVYFTQSPEQPFRFTLVTARQRVGWLILVGGDFIGVLSPTPSRFKYEFSDDQQDFVIVAPNGKKFNSDAMNLGVECLTKMTPDLKWYARETLPKLEYRLRQRPSGGPKETTERQKPSRNRLSKPSRSPVTRWQA
jgi:DNA invertase Pin-like site-specific DNA recombinase